MMKSMARSALILLVSASSSFAFEATLTKASSLKAHPVADVSKGALDALRGIPIAEPRAAVAYEPEVGGHAAVLGLRNVPIPKPRPQPTLNCPIVWRD